MQIQCQHCHKPYALNKETLHQALDQIVAADQGHYNAHCPHCGKTNKVGRAQLMRAAPDWEKKEAEPGS